MHELGNPPAQRRSESRRADGGDAVHREREAAALGRKAIGEDRLHHRLQPTAERALQRAGHEQDPQARRHGAEDRAKREQGNARHEEAFAAEQLDQPAADREHDRVGNEVRGQHPRTLAVTGAEVAGDVGQRHVRDAGVEDFHERGQRDDHGDHPGVHSRTPRLRYGTHRTRASRSHSATSSRKTFSTCSCLR